MGILILSVFCERFSGGIEGLDCVGGGCEAGECVPFALLDFIPLVGVGVEVPLPRCFCALTSLRHLDTISLARREISRVG